MRGINPERIAEFIAKDVKKIEDYAKIILTLSPNNDSIEIRENEHPRMNTIAVIGPSFGFDRQWDRVLLLEIGIDHTRPYHEVKGIDKKPAQSHIHDRRKWFNLSVEQYKLIVPILFKKIDFLTQEKVSSWKSGSPNNKFIVPCSWHWWFRGRGKTVTYDSSFKIPSGISFSVSLKDEFLLYDICWAELNSNILIRRLVEGMAKFISLRLSYYHSRKHYTGKREFGQLKGAKEVETKLKNSYLWKCPHLLVEVVTKIKKRRKCNFWQYVADLIGWDGKETEQRKMASMALPDPRSRLGSVQIHLTPSNTKRKRDYIVFEVQK